MSIRTWIIRRNSFSFFKEFFNLGQKKSRTLHLKDALCNFLSFDGILETFLFNEWPFLKIKKAPTRLFTDFPQVVTDYSGDRIKLEDLIIVITQLGGGILCRKGARHLEEGVKKKEKGIMGEY